MMLLIITIIAFVGVILWSIRSEMRALDKMMNTDLQRKVPKDMRKNATVNWKPGNRTWRKY